MTDSVQKAHNDFLQVVAAASFLPELAVDPFPCDFRIRGLLGAILFSAALEYVRVMVRDSARSSNAIDADGLMADMEALLKDAAANFQGAFELAAEKLAEERSGRLPQ